METVETTVETKVDGVYTRSQARRKKKIEGRRKKHGGKGRSDGPRQRKGVRNTAGKRLRAKHFARLIAAPAKTHDVVFGVDTKNGKPVLRLEARTEKGVVV
jgi:hypothetical protein